MIYTDLYYSKGVALGILTIMQFDIEHLARFVCGSILSTVLATVNQDYPILRGDWGKKDRSLKIRADPDKLLLRDIR